tara:strand:+ start:630 stop:920 length:291 start_codon:yes stop_codon:yes gene_type:complete
MSDIIITVDEYNKVLKSLYLSIKEKYNHDDMLSVYRYPNDLDNYLNSLMDRYYIELIDIDDIIKLRAFYKDVFSINVREAAIKLYIKRHLKLGETA